MCVLGVDAFNLSMLISQSDAKILADILSKVSNADLIDVAMKGGHSAHDVVGATASFVSHVTRILQFLQELNAKREKESNTPVTEPSTGMIQ